MKLTFNDLRNANIARCFVFKDRHGRLSHPGGVHDWTPDQWLKSLVGEIGEFANGSKKLDRGDMTEAEFRDYAAKELADVQCYLDLLAASLNIDLGQATVDKFNKVSDRVGSSVKLGAHP